MDFSPVYRIYDWLWATRIMGTFTAMHLTIVLAIAWFVYKIYADYRLRHPVRKYMLCVRCNNCGCLTEVSEFARVCMQCRGTNLKIMKPDEYKLAKQQQRKSA